MRFPIIIPFILLTFGCSDKPGNSDQLEVSIPDTTDQLAKNYFEGIKNATHELNLYDLRTVIDKPEIRIWALIGVWSRHRLYILKPSNNDWSCLEYEFINSRPEPTNGTDMRTYFTNYKIDTFQVRKCPTEISWTELTQQLTDQGIYDLPTQTEIPNWKNRVSDGHTFVVEYVNDNKYGFYFYNCPDVYSEDFEASRKMTNILRLLESEVGFAMWNDYDFRCKK